MIETIVIGVGVYSVQRPLVRECHCPWVASRDYEMNPLDLLNKMINIYNWKKINIFEIETLCINRLHYFSNGIHTCTFTCSPKKHITISYAVLSITISNNYYIIYDKI